MAIPIEVRTLLNQWEDERHHSASPLAFDDHSQEEAAQVSSGEIARTALGTLGYEHFIPHSELGFMPATNCQYLIENCLHFRVIVELHHIACDPSM